MAMKKMPFLRDVDDVNLYAKMLENVFTLLYEEFSETLAKFPVLETRGRWIDESFSQLLEVSEIYDELARIRHTMSLMIRDMADRKRRLSDATRGLADVEFEKD